MLCTTRLLQQHSLKTDSHLSITHLGNILDNSQPALVAVKDNSNPSHQTLKCHTVLDLIILITSSILNKPTNFNNQVAFSLHTLPKIQCLLDLAIIVATT